MALRPNIPQDNAQRSDSPSLGIRSLTVYAEPWRRAYIFGRFANVAVDVTFRDFDALKPRPEESFQDGPTLSVSLKARG
jgi:hypothetical protein